MSANGRLLELVSDGIEVTTAGKMLGLSPERSWEAYSEAMLVSAAMGNRALLAELGVGPEAIMKAPIDALKATRHDMVAGGTKDTPAQFIEVDDHPTRLKAAGMLGKWTGMDPGEKIEVRHGGGTVIATVDLNSVVAGGSGEDIMDALRKWRSGNGG